MLSPRTNEIPEALKTQSFGIDRGTTGEGGDLGVGGFDIDVGVQSHVGRTEMEGETRWVVKGEDGVAPAAENKSLRSQTPNRGWPLAGERFVCTCFFCGGAKGANWPRLGRRSFPSHHQLPQSLPTLEL